MAIQLFTALLAVLVPASASGQASLTPLGDIPGGAYFSRAHGISADGSTVVGESRGTSGQPRAFVWDAVNGMQDVGVLPDHSPANSFLYGVSSDGSVAAGSGSGLVAVVEPVGWDAMNGVQKLAGFPSGGAFARVYDISGDGSQVVGFDDGQAYRWSVAGGFEGLGDLPGGSASSRAWAISDDGSTIVGRGQSGEVPEAVFWDANGDIHSLNALMGVGSSIAHGVSGDGRFIVGESDSGAFLWDQETQTMQVLAPPSVDGFREALDVSDDGRIVVGSRYPQPVGQAQTAFVWDPYHGARTVFDVLTDQGVDASGWEFIDVAGVSADGRRLVGWAYNPAGALEGYLATIDLPVPAPTLSGSQLGALVACLLVTGAVALRSRVVPGLG